MRRLRIASHNLLVQKPFRKKRAKRIRTSSIGRVKNGLMQQLIVSPILKKLGNLELVDGLELLKASM